MKRIFTLLVALALLNASATNASAESLRPDHWASPHFADHPLVGSVWRGDGERSDWTELSSLIFQASFVLVGETHTNVDHHMLQANVLHLLAKRGRRPTVVWEMIPEDRQSLLDSPDLRTADAARKLGTSLDWAASGWPAWPMYQPIAIAAVNHGLPMRGAALSSQFLHALARNGGADLNPAQRRRLNLNHVLSRVHSDSMLQVLFDSHCQLMEKQAMAPMQLVQRARDGAMADAMLLGAATKNAEPTSTASQHDGAVLIAGNGHVRKDWAVPALLARSRPQASRLSIAQVEVDRDVGAASEYAELAAGEPLYDFVIFTPRSEIRDHCAELRKSLKR